MASTDKPTERSLLVHALGRFFAGTVLGSFLILLPVLYSEIGNWQQISGIQLGLMVFVVTSCGVISVKLGERFLEAVMNGLDNSGF